MTTYIEKIFKMLFIAVICAYFILSIWANSDMTKPYSLFMDEITTYSGVSKILHPETFKNFLYNINDGNYHMYGRILFNSMALFSYIPEKLFGDEGQIFAGRITQSIILIIAYVLMSFTFAKNWFFRFLLLGLLFSMPFTSYYMSMPKPEPQQLLCLALFLYF